MIRTPDASPGPALRSDGPSRRIKRLTLRMKSLSRRSAEVFLRREGEPLRIEWPLLQRERFSLRSENLFVRSARRFLRRKRRSIRSVGAFPRSAATGNGVFGLIRAFAVRYTRLSAWNKFSGARALKRCRACSDSWGNALTRRRPARLVRAMCPCPPGVWLVVGATLGWALRRARRACSVRKECSDGTQLFHRQLCRAVRG